MGKRSNKDIPSLTTTIDPNLADITLIQDDVRLTLKQLESNKASRPDGLPTHVLKDCADKLVEPITELFNHSLSQGSILQEWKEAIVVLVFKKGNTKTHPTIAYSQ